MRADTVLRRIPKPDGQWSFAAQSKDIVGFVSQNLGAPAEPQRFDRLSPNRVQSPRSSNLAIGGEQR